jgi:hypothetical protein
MKTKDETLPEAPHARLDSRLLLLSPADNCLVLRAFIPAGEVMQLEQGLVTLAKGLDLGHKIARGHLKAGERILKYGASIGILQSDLQPGEHIHTHNLSSDYTPTYVLPGNEVNAH